MCDGNVLRTAIDTERERCCQDMCHWCHMHATGGGDQKAGPAIKQDGELGYSHMIPCASAGYVPVWCAATKIRERANREARA